MILRTKIMISFLIIVAAILMSASCDSRHDEVTIDDRAEPIKIDLRSTEKQMVKSDQEFAFNFFSKVFAEEANDEDNSFMVSPLSLSMALAMTLNGAEGDTKVAMQETLNLDGFSEHDINGYYKKLRYALLATDPSTKLSIANSIWTNKNIPVNKDFLKVNVEFFNSKVASVNFSDERAAVEINKWASDNTNGLIEKVIDKTKADDLMYLLNAIYFKGVWVSEFKKSNTLKKTFTLENGSLVDVDMMNQTAEFNYNSNDDLQIVQLPYGNEAFSMMVLLPKDNKKLHDVVEAIKEPNYWSSLIAGSRKYEVVLSLPKFKTTYSKKLNNVLMDMGMGVAFSDNADFSGLSEVSSKIDFVNQNTYISTDEVGTEAAAVTTIGMVVTSMPIEPERVIFNANKPFLYVIQENYTGSILFMGAVKDIN